MLTATATMTIESPTREQVGKWASDCLRKAERARRSGQTIQAERYARAAAAWLRLRREFPFEK